MEQRREVQVDEPDRGGRDRDHLALLHPAVHPVRLPFSDEFDWKLVNYAPILTIGTMLLLAIWWNVSAKKWFTGPKSTIDEAVVRAFDGLSRTATRHRPQAENPRSTTWGSSCARLK